jgi:hypothetical protein
MNIVRRGRLGQFPGEGIAADITLGPQDTGTDTFPMYYDPGLLLAEQGAQAPAPAVSVPQPSGSPVYATFGPYGTLDPTAATAQIPAPGSISPAPHVAIPTTDQFFGPYGGLLNKTFLGFPAGIWLAVGGLVLVLSSGGGRRRR